MTTTSPGETSPAADCEARRLFGVVDFRRPAEAQNGLVHARGFHDGAVGGYVAREHRQPAVFAESVFHIADCAVRPVSVVGAVVFRLRPRPRAEFAARGRAVHFPDFVGAGGRHYVVFFYRFPERAGVDGFDGGVEQPRAVESPRIPNMPPARLTSWIWTFWVVGATLQMHGVFLESASMSAMEKSTSAPRYRQKVEDGVCAPPSRCRGALR